MFSWATLMNWRSVAEHVCETAARPFPPSRRTSEPVAKIATANPAAAVKRGFTLPVFGEPRGWAPSPFRGLSQKIRLRYEPWRRMPMPSYTRIAAAFSGLTNKQTVGTSPSSRRQRSRIPRFA